MFKVYKKEIEVAGKKISLETGKVARQADGAIIASCGETVILATVVGAKKVNPDMDYFPLSVNYQEKYYAGGKIPGGYFKREARPTESETLISRLIDRPIRPLFPEGFLNAVHIVITVMSAVGINQPENLATIGVSAALGLSDIPFVGTVAGVTVGYIDGEYILMGEDGTVKTSEGYPILQYATGKFWVNNHTHVLRAKKPYNNYFVWNFLLKLNLVLQL